MYVALYVCDILIVTKNCVFKYSFSYKHCIYFISIDL